MQTVQIVLDEALLQATDQAARRLELNRSAMVRDALRQYLKRLRVEELERQDREGFQRMPDTDAELAMWEQVAVWPEE